MFLSLIFVVSGCSFVAESNENIKNFSESLDLKNKATEISNKAGDEKRQFTADEYTKFLEYQKSSLEKAKTVDIEKLNNDYKDFGNQYKENFIGGLALVIVGWEERNNDKLMQGQILSDKWWSWYDTNIEKIKKLK